VLVGRIVELGAFLLRLAITPLEPPVHPALIGERTGL
jgi:hypothetical protein